MTLLHNELVKKYFGCEPLTTKNCYHDFHQCDQAMAYRVLAAMETPIRKGERRLYIDGMGAVWDGVHPVDLNPDYHPDYLRLPDAFQPKAEHKFDPPKCEHGVEARLIFPCNECTARLNNKEKRQMIPCDEPMNHPKGCEHQKPDPVEDRDVEANIQSLLNNWNTLNQTALENCLRWLVALARGRK